MDVDWGALRDAATKAMRRAYAPYSGFPVGAAALVDDGRTVAGCNVENASYGLTLCAECGLVSQLHATGGGRLVALSCVDADGNPLTSCGRCRQLIAEHGGPECLVDTAAGPRTIADLLPDAFDAGYLPRSQAAAPGSGRAASPGSGQAAASGSGRAATPGSGRATTPGSGRAAAPAGADPGGGSGGGPAVTEVADTLPATDLPRPS